MLTKARIAALAAQPNVRKVAVENFLGSLGNMTKADAVANLVFDAKLYKWNPATIAAIKTGIDENFA